MTRPVWAALGLLLAAGAQATLGTYLPEAAGVFDFFLILAIYYALATGQVTGMLVGVACGLVQDGLLGSGPMGRSAFAKALIGYAVGGLGRRVELDQPLPQLLVLIGATLLQALTIAALHLVLGLPADLPSGRRLVMGMAGNGLLGIALFRAGRIWPGKSR